MSIYQQQEEEIISHVFWEYSTVGAITAVSYCTVMYAVFARIFTTSLVIWFKLKSCVRKGSLSVHRASSCLTDSQCQKRSRDPRLAQWTWKWGDFQVDSSPSPTNQTNLPWHFRPAGVVIGDGDYMYVFIKVRFTVLTHRLARPDNHFTSPCVLERIWNMFSDFLNECGMRR